MGIEERENVEVSETTTYVGGARWSSSKHATYGHVWTEKGMNARNRARYDRGRLVAETTTGVEQDR